MQVSRGLQQCIQSGNAWPPSLPQFRGYCEDTLEELGLPSVEEVYKVARQQRPDWSQVHPVVYHARQMVGMPEMVAEADGVVRPRFKKAYQALVGRVLAGEKFELPVLGVPQLEHQRLRQVTAPGDARVHLKVLRERLISPVSR